MQAHWARAKVAFNDPKRQPLYGGFLPLQKVEKNSV